MTEAVAEDTESTGISRKTAYYKRIIAYTAGPVAGLLDDANVSEIMINGPNEIFVEAFDPVEKRSLLRRHTETFANDGELENFARSILQFVGKRLVPENPSVEARLPDNSRVHIVQAPSARPGICIAIRKFAETKLTLDQLIEKSSLTPTAAKVLGHAVRSRHNIMISGGTGTGKTTMLNVLASQTQEDERIIVIEDASEIQIRDRHVVQFEVTPPDRYGRGGAGIRDLFKASLRMRPDRVIVGECRGGEALDMIQAMNSGHSGSLSTVHANSPVDALVRLETLCMMSDVEMPLRAIRAQVASAIDVVIQIQRTSHIRRVSNIDYVLPLENEEYGTQPLFTLKESPQATAPDGLMLQPTEHVKTFLNTVPNH